MTQEKIIRNCETLLEGNSKQEKGKGYSLVFGQKRTWNNGTQSELSRLGRSLLKSED